MVVELAITLVEAAIGIIKSSSENREAEYIRTRLNEISEVVVDMQQSLEHIKQEIMDREDPEVQRFHRAKATAARLFHTDWDESLLDFATELLAAVMDATMAGLRIQAHSTVQDPDQAVGFREKSFHTVVMASKSIFDNAKELCSFFEQLVSFNGLKPISLRKQPSITVSLAAEESRDLAQYDRIKSRICIRLGLLNTLSFNWATDSLGTLVSDKRYIVRSDKTVCKFVNGLEQCNTLVKAVRDRMRNGFNNEAIAEVWRNLICSGVGCVRVIILSQNAWRNCENAVHVKQITHSIRTYVESFEEHEVKWLEILVDNLDDWDAVNLKRAIVNELSTSVVVFRFSCIAGLRRLVCTSKAITDMFSGLTSHKNRIMYVDTTTTCNFRDRRASIRQVAKSLRLLEPTEEVDILFEADERTSVSKDLNKRALCTKSLLCNWYKGESRQHLESIVHILNREIDSAAAKKESEEVMHLTSRLRSPLRTHVRVYRDPNLVLIQRGDSTGFGLSSSSACYMREENYGDFRDITDKCPPQVSAKIVLTNVPPDLLDTTLVSSKWKVVQKMEKMVGDSKLFMAVAGERLCTLNRRQGKLLTGVVVTVAGGGMREFLYGKMIWSSMKAVETDLSHGLDVMRALLRIAPALQVATKCSAQLSKLSSTHSLLG